MQVAKERLKTGAAKAPSPVALLAGALLLLNGASGRVQAQETTDDSSSQAVQSTAQADPSLMQSDQSQSAADQSPARADASHSQTEQLQAEARRAQWLGLFRVRDLTPFGLTRLDFLPAHSVSEPPHTFAMELGVSYQNTFARSKNVGWYLEQRGNGRKPITTADINTITSLGGDAYLVDGEYGLIDLTLHYKMSSH